MLSELSDLLSELPPESERADYATAIIEENVLGKQTTATRRLTNQRLGELYEAQGDRDKAVEHYNEFVEMWQDADPELQPQVNDVRERLARLVGER